MENQSYGKNFLLLEGLQVNQESSYPAFILLLIIYIFIMVTNVGLVVLIVTEKSLHQPMYLLFCNLPINDALGATAIVPRILSDMFVADEKRFIHYTECAIQAFCAHIYGGSSHIILIIMAFDRYVAICNPLRYASIMTAKMVAILTLSAWGITFILVAVLLGLSVRLSRCRSFVPNPYCDNASLFKLSCEDVTINNIYGLTFTVFFIVCSVGSVTLTYLRIAIVCLKSKNKALNSKALQTCGTHLSVYVIMLVSGFSIIILHRFPLLAVERKLAAILFHVFPPAINAVIYGLQTKDIRKKIFDMFHHKVIV
ncbi:olfactory receptor 52E4-like [Aplochiton taeniatus]